MLSKILTAILAIGLLTGILTFINRQVSPSLSNNPNKEIRKYDDSSYIWDEEIGAYLLPTNMSTEQRDAATLACDINNLQKDRVFYLEKVEKTNDCKLCYLVIVTDKNTKEQIINNVSIEKPDKITPVELVQFPENEIKQSEALSTGENNISIDLDGDGKNENISVDLYGNFAVVNVNDQKIKVYFYAYNFAISDINPKDKYKEILLFNPGPSNDDSGYFLAYNDGKIYKMGNPGRWPIFNTNGEVDTCIWQGFWCKINTYKMDDEHTRFVQLPSKETFYIGVNSTAVAPFDIYNDKSLTTIITTIKIGQKFEVVSVYINKENQNIYEIEAGGVAGWVGEDFLGSSGISPAD